MTHGIFISHYGVRATLPPHEKLTIEFYARDAGKFSFRCAHFCGLGHPWMTGELIVEE